MEQAQANLDWILLHDVSPVAKDILRERIEEDIYAAYTPAYYERRYELTKHVDADLIASGALLVTSLADASPSVIPDHKFENRYAGAFLEMLEVGNMGFWRKDFPRKAVAITRGIIENSSEIRRAIEAGIQREFT